MLDFAGMAELRRVDSRGTVNLPVAVRRGIDLVEVVRREDGVIELRPRMVVDPEQGWFWSERWQAMEREADEDIQQGRLISFDDAEAFLADLDASGDQAAAPTSTPNDGTSRR